MEKITYTLKRYKRSKKLRLIIKNTGDIVITAPYRVSQKYIDTFFMEQKKWIEEKVAIFKSMPQPDVKTKRGDYKKYKEEALRLVTTRIEKINLFYKFKFNTITIRNQKTRWGSCSHKKNLNFNYKVVFLPLHLLDYVITHELCHLQEMNHGENFWKLIEQTDSEYQKHHKELKMFKV